MAADFADFGDFIFGTARKALADVKSLDQRTQISGIREIRGMRGVGGARRVAASARSPPAAVAGVRRVLLNPVQVV